MRSSSRATLCTAVQFQLTDSCSVPVAVSGPVPVAVSGVLVSGSRGTPGTSVGRGHQHSCVYLQVGRRVEGPEGRGKREEARGEREARLSSNRQ